MKWTNQVLEMWVLDDDFQALTPDQQDDLLLIVSDATHNFLMHAFGDEANCGDEDGPGCHGCNIVGTWRTEEMDDGEGDHDDSH